MLPCNIKRTIASALRKTIVCTMLFRVATLRLRCYSDTGVFQRALFHLEKRMQKYNKFMNFANFRPSNAEKHGQIPNLCYLCFAISLPNGWRQSWQASLRQVRG